MANLRQHAAFVALALFCLAHPCSAQEATNPDLLIAGWGRLTDVGSEIRQCLMEAGEESGGGHHAAGLKSGRPDTHAPGHLMGDHSHAQGSRMVEYKYMNMYMGGNRAGHTPLTTGQARMFDGNMFMVVPTSMTMEMHMLHYMWAPNDRLTMYLMPMWSVNTMDHTRFDMSGGTSTFRKTNAGFSDLPFGALWQWKEDEDSELIVNFGFAAPTGDIDNTTSNPMGMQAEFPYPMRLGRGSWAARPGLTYKAYSERGVRGLQFQSDIMLGANREGYSASDEYRLNGWITRLAGEEKRTAFSLRAEVVWRSNFRGVDSDLNPAMVHTARPDYRGGEWVNLGYGVIHTLKDGSRLNFEIAHPLYQHLDGVQLETNWSLAASWSRAF